MTMSDFLREFRRRNMLRAGILYATGVWALAQGIAQLEPVVGAPDWTARWFLVAAGIGFPFWIAFAWFYELTPQGLRRESEVPPNESIARATGRKLDLWIIGVLTVAVVLLLTDRFALRNEAGGGEAGGGAATAIPGKSIAVLPLVNESGDPAGLYFSDGLSEDLITALSRFSGLKVIGRDSAFLFRSTKDTSAVIGKKLGVAHLLEGSVRRAGGMVRVSAALIDVRDGSTRWSEHYDRPYKDLFKLQDDITNAVASALKAKLLGGGATPQTDRPPSGNLAAYNAYLEGQFYGRHHTESDFRTAIDAYGTATRLDPRYAQAWAGMATTWDNLAANFLGGAAQQEAYAKGRNAAGTALALAPDLATAHSARGALLQDADSDWAGAEAEYRRALELAPNSSAAKGNLAAVLATLGQLEEAAELQRQAIAADPLRADFYQNFAVYLSPLGRLDEAEHAIRNAIELQPTAVFYHAVLSTIEIQRGNAKGALEAANAEPPGLWHDVAVAQALQIGADRAAADAALKSLIGKYGDLAMFQIAEAYALRNEPDKMFTWLDRAMATRDPGLQTVLYDPFLQPYMQDPRFAALCRKLNLPVPQAKG